MHYKSKQQQKQKRQRRSNWSSVAIAHRRAKHLVKRKRAILNRFCKKHIKLQARLATSDGARAQPDSDGDICHECIQPELQDNIQASASEGDVSYSGYNILHGFTTSLADADLERLNTQVPFDTDSIFFVCDNSTTGHICNNL